jgi:hypothetical protein
MGFRTIAYYQSANPTAYTAINVVSDSTMTQIDGQHFKVPSQDKLLAAYGYGTILTRYQIQTPSLRSNRVPLEIDDVDQTASNPTVTNPPLIDFSQTPVQLTAGEGLEADIITTGGTAAANLIALWLGDGKVEPVSGIFLPKVRATSATTLTAGAWTPCVLTFDYQLPAGAYAVVGMRAGSATGVLARLAFPELGPRPGVLCGKFPSTRTAVPFSPEAPVGGFRVPHRSAYVSWGSFVSDAPPSVEFLALAADTSEVVELDLVKIA